MFRLFERGVGSKEEEGRPGSHRRGQEEEEEEKEEGGQEGKGEKFGGRGRRRRRSGGREGLEEKEGEGEEEEKEQSSCGEDGRGPVFRGRDPATGASVWAEDGAVSPGVKRVLGRLLSQLSAAFRFQINLDDT